jgi:hypothetical protein
MPALMSEAKAVIEDLGDWIGEAFWRFSAGQEWRAGERYPLASKSQTGRRSNSSSSKHPGRLNTHTSKTVPSPFNSETETDDSAITFVPKKLRSPTHSTPNKYPNGAHNLQPPACDERQYSSSSDETIRVDNHEQNGPHHENSRTFRSETSPPNGDLGDAKGTHHGTPPPGWGAKSASQTISEIELMRRRRLLDSHIFD